jgi:hypothetical protein
MPDLPARCAGALGSDNSDHQLQISCRLDAQLGGRLALETLREFDRLCEGLFSSAMYHGCGLGILHLINHSARGAHTVALPNKREARRFPNF